MEAKQPQSFLILEKDLVEKEQQLKWDSIIISIEKVTGKSYFISAARTQNLRTNNHVKT
jgi:hypothetical protein